MKQVITDECCVCGTEIPVVVDYFEESTPLFRKIRDNVKRYCPKCTIRKYPLLVAAVRERVSG